MRRLLFVTLAALAFAPVSTHAQARTLTLTLDEALTIAKRNNPNYLQTINNRRRTALGGRTAYGSFTPQISSNLGFGWREGRPTFFEGQQVGAGTDVLSSNYGINVSLGYSFQSLLGPKQQGAQLDAAEAGVEQQGQSLRQQITNAYFIAVGAVRSAELNDSLVNTQRLQLSLAQAKESVGSGTPLETKSAEVRVRTQEIAALKAHNQADIAKIQLFQQMGTPSPGDVTLTTELAVVEPKFKLEDLIAQSKTGNASLTVSRANEKVASVTKRQSMSGYVPSIGFNTGFGGQTSMNADATGADRVWPFDFSRNPLNFSAGLSLPLWNGYQREAQVQTAALSLDNARQDLRRVELQTVADVTSAYLNLMADWKTIELQTISVATAKETVALATERYRVGAADYIQLSTAIDQYQNAENQRLNAIYQYHRDFATLEAAVGRPLR